MCIMINTKTNELILNSVPEDLQTKITAVTIFLKNRMNQK